MLNWVAPLMGLDWSGGVPRNHWNESGLVPLTITCSPTDCPALIDVDEAEANAPDGATQLGAMLTVTVRVFVGPHVLTSCAQKFVVLVIAGVVNDAPVPT